MAASATNSTSHARRSFTDRLAQRPLLLDGAMGTLLFSRGIPQRASLDELVESHPDLVGAIHREYITAGADIVETCTFGASRLRLAPFGLADRAGRINRRAAQVAREARDVAGREVLVAGSIGPLGAPMHLADSYSEAEIRAAFREQIEGLLEGGVDLLLVETSSNLAELLMGVDEARALCDLPVVTSMTFGEDMVAMDGTTPVSAAIALAAAGVDAIGVNCGVGPEVCLDALGGMGVDPDGPPRLIMPNAGLPRRVESQFIYAAGPAYFADAVPRFLAAGARLLGGCCGTTPVHIAAMRAALDRSIGVIDDADAGNRADDRAPIRDAGSAEVAVGAAAGTDRTAPAAGQAFIVGTATGAEAPRTGTATGARAPVTGAATGAEAPRTGTATGAGADGAVGGLGAPLGAGTPRATLVERESNAAADLGPPPPTRLATAIAEGRFVISVEIDPPRSVRIDRTIGAARLLRDAGVDVVNISDSAMARVRMGAMAVAFGIQQELDLECLVHLTTRDRNLMALESELLGAHALGVRNILALTGDPPRIGDYPTGTGIWDIDSTGLIRILARLNRGEDQAGKPIGAPAGFTIACALDPTAANIEHELDRLAGKIAAGAHVIMTQPIYAPDQWDRFMERAAARWSDRLPLPVLLGVLPLHTGRHAEFLHNEVPGITIPDRVRAAMASAGERGAEVGLEMAMELLTHMRPLVQGTYIMPSFGRYELGAELVRRLRAMESAGGRSSAPDPGPEAVGARA